MTFCKIQHKLRFHNLWRIYWIFSLNLLQILLFCPRLCAQIALETNDYRTISSGNFQNPGIWETWNGAAWMPTTIKPGRNNNIFIDQGFEVRLTQNEEAKNVYLFSAASPGRKLNLQNFELQVYGALRGMDKTAGIFIINSVTNATTDWIYPETGKIVFKGISRTVVDRISWSANTTNSRFTVVFEPDFGETLIVNSAFKANRFIIQSGTVIQTVNTMGIPACSTFSFNSQAIFNGSNPYGDLIIEPLATLISACSAPLSAIIRRSESIPGALFHLKPTGNLILSGNIPTMDVANFLMEGSVYYSSNTGNQQMLRSTMATSGRFKTYQNLFFENAATKTLNDSIFLRGNFVYLNGGAVLDRPTFLRFEGAGAQQIINLEMDLHQIEVNKPSGTLLTNNNLRIKSNFLMKNGRVDFGGNRLFLNTSGNGFYTYQGGSWLNLSQLVYNQIPMGLNGSNAAFPFEDFYQGGIREVRLLGNSPGGNLSIRFLEFPGADWDPSFNDSDGTPILYQLYSFFEFSGLNAGTDDLELRISAKNLIVDDVDDLRIVSLGQAAPGTHLPGLDPDKLWARRQLTFGELNNQTLTVGSFRIMSILPVTWLQTSAKRIAAGAKVNWSTAKETNNHKFKILQSLGNVASFKSIREVPSWGDSDIVQHYEFEHHDFYGAQPVYFKIEQVDKDGKSTLSKVFRMINSQNPDRISGVKIWPNPYSSGRVSIVLSEFFEPKTTIVQIHNPQGVILYHDLLDKLSLEKELEGLKPGLYYISFVDRENHQYLRLLKD